MSIEFLLLHPQFPRSVRFCLEGSGQPPGGIEGLDPGRKMSRADREFGLVLSEFRSATWIRFITGNLHVFLTGALEWLQSSQPCACKTSIRFVRESPAANPSAQP